MKKSLTILITITTILFINSCEKSITSPVEIEKDINILHKVGSDEISDRISQQTIRDVLDMPAPILTLSDYKVPPANFPWHPKLSWEQYPYGYIRTQVWRQVRLWRNHFPYGWYSWSDWEFLGSEYYPPEYIDYEITTLPFWLDKVRYKVRYWDSSSGETSDWSNTVFDSNVRVQ